jgi:hypothetical protein
LDELEKARKNRLVEREEMMESGWCGGRGEVLTMKVDDDV